MYLSRIEIRNFRGIPSIGLECHEGLNVIIGENNTGKTAILDALRLCLSFAQERRDFFRLKFSNPVRFKAYSDRVTPQKTEEESATAKDISSAGILFQTHTRPPDLSSILWLNLDYRMLKICQEIDARALIFNDGILGRVVRVEENPTDANAYDIGVCFLTKDQKDSKTVQKVIAEITETTS